MSKGQELAIVLYLINVRHSPADTVLPLVKKIDLIFNSLYFLSMCNGLFFLTCKLYKKKYLPFSTVFSVIEGIRPHRRKLQTIL